MINKAKIYDALVMLSVSLGQKQDSERLRVYVEHLKDFNTEAVIRQIESFTDTAEYFPALVKIIEPLKGLNFPTEEMATIIASEIIECISRFGPYQINDMKEHLGNKFQIIERSGGWQALCQITYDEVPTTRAQLRELARAYINRSKREDSESGFKLSTESRPVIDSSARQLNNGTGLKKLHLEIL